MTANGTASTTAKVAESAQKDVIKATNGSATVAPTTVSDSDAVKPSSSKKVSDLKKAEGKVDFPWEKVGFYIDPNNPPSIEALRKLSYESSSKVMYKYVAEKYYGDLWWNTSLAVGTLLAAWFIGRIGGGLFALLFVLIAAFTVYRTELRRFNINLRDDMLRVSSYESLENRTETMNWLNSFLAKFWVIYMPALSDMVITQANATLKDIEPPTPIKKLSLDEFTLGSKAPAVNAIRSVSKLGPDVYQMEWDFGFTPNDTDGMTKEELSKKVDPKVALGISVGKGVVSASLPILVEDMSFAGHMRITFKLGESFPFIEVVSIMFLEPPSIDYALKPVGGNTFGLDIMSMIPGLSSFVNGIINSTLAPMMYKPNSMDINVREIMEGMMPGAVGCLGVRIRAAEYLKSTDINPYLTFGLEQKANERYNTDIKAATNTPVFNETKYILVDNLQQKLQLELHSIDEKDGDTHDLAVGEFELNSLLQADEQPMTEIKLTHKGRNVGRAVVDISWFPVLEGELQSDGSHGPAPESDIGIFDLTLESAKDLDISKSLLGKLSSYAEVKIGGKLVGTSRLVKSSNRPSYALRVEELTRSKGSSPIKITIKDISSYGETKIGSYYSPSLEDLVGMGAEKGKWIKLTKGAGELRVKVNWKPLSAVGMAEEETFNPPVGTLRVLVSGCDNLPNIVTMGTIDPFVRVVAGGSQRALTKTVQDSTSPKFNEVFYVPVSSGNEQVSLQAVDSSKNKILGSIVLDTARFFEEGYDPQKDSSKGLTKGTLTRDGNSRGTISYKIVYLPIVPVYSKKELQEKANKKTKNRSEELDELDEQSKLLEDYKKHPDDYVWVDENADDDSDNGPSIPKVEMPLQQLLQHNSGVLGLNVTQGTLSSKKAYVQFLFDERAYPDYVTRSSKGGKLTSGTGSAFIRDLENSQVTLRLTSKPTVTSRSDVLAVTEKPIKVKQLLQDGFEKPTTISFAGNKINLSTEYAPCTVDLGPSETMADTGLLQLSIISASGLRSADSGGSSDPYVEAIVDGTQVFRSQTVKKSLNPEWNENCSINVPSRTRSEIRLEVFDWDRTGTNDSLGYVIMDLTKLPVDKATAMEFKFNTQGTLKIAANFKPMYIQPSVAAASGGSALDGLAGAPIKLVGNAAGLATGAAGAAVGGALNVTGDVAGGATKAVGAVGGGAVKAVGGITGGITKGFHHSSSSKKTSAPSSPQKASRTASRLSTDSGVSFASTSMGDSMPGRISITSFKSEKITDSLSVKVSLASTKKTKDIFKTHAAKYNSSSGSYTWNESVPFKAPPEARIVFSVREHHKLGKASEVGNAEVALADLATKGGKLTLPVGPGELTVSFNYLGQ